jgi:cytochrome c
MCVACHGVKLEGGLGPALAGGVGSLTTDKPLKTIGSYWPYATTLFDYIRRAMPFQAPQSMSNDDVYGVTAYLLHKNGILPANATVDAASLAKVKMPNRDNFYVDDRPDVKAGRCMKDCLSKK